MFMHTATTTKRLAPAWRATTPTKGVAICGASHGPSDTGNPCIPGKQHRQKPLNTRKAASPESPAYQESSVARNPCIPGKQHRPQTTLHSQKTPHTRKVAANWNGASVQSPTTTNAPGESKRVGEQQRRDAKSTARNTRSHRCADKLLELRGRYVPYA